MKWTDLPIIVIGFIPYLLLSYGIAKNTVKQSLSTWMLWLTLDVIVVSALIAQKGNYIVFAVFTVGTLLVNIFLFAKKQFKWEGFDTIVTILVFVCIIIFYVSGPYGATIATTIALTVAGLPQVKSTWEEPEKTPTLPYFLFAITSLLSVIGAKEWSVPERLPQMSSVIFTTIIIILSLRRKVN